MNYFIALLIKCSFNINIMNNKETNYHNIIAQNIKKHRKSAKLSQEKLAELANVSIRTISDIERGLTDIRYTNLLQIAEAFELTLSQLLNFKF